ncbi:hypothetical protein LWI28_023122 [Acer negundo]|uniref:Uncharacterized protein n=1 Tax=Acer negundo TaxID=4023 RepID=A0AAD5NHB8_ACENE|nr:hypothetical protein LWI28_023122 [Acer negundo]
MGMMVMAALQTQNQEMVYGSGFLKVSAQCRSLIIPRKGRGQVLTQATENKRLIASPDQEVLAAASEEDDQDNGNGPANAKDLRGKVSVVDDGEERSPLYKNRGIESRQEAEREEVTAGLKKTAWNSDVGDVGGVGNDRSMMRFGRKKIHSVKSHGMKTRHSKARALDLNHDLGNENITPKVKKAPWKLKDEIAKVIKARVALGFDVKGREKDMVEEIVRRIKASTFGELEGILPCNNK